MKMEKITILKIKQNEIENEIKEINFKIRTDSKNRGKYLLSRKEHELYLKKNKKEIELEQVKKEIEVFKNNM